MGGGGGFHWFLGARSPDLPLALGFAPFRVRPLAVAWVGARCHQVEAPWGWARPADQRVASVRARCQEVFAYLNSNLVGAIDGRLVEGGRWVRVIDGVLAGARFRPSMRLGRQV